MILEEVVRNKKKYINICGIRVVAQFPVGARVFRCSYEFYYSADFIGLKADIEIVSSLFSIYVNITKSATSNINTCTTN